MAGREGALTGLNVEQLLRRLERRPLSGGNEFRTGRTPFEKINVSIKVAQGIATVEDVSLQGPAVKLALAGSASIPTRDLDLKGTASLIDTAKDGQAGFDLPFVVQGPWDDPIMLPDPQILIRRSGAAAPLFDRLRDQRTRDAVRSAIEKLSGGKLANPEGEQKAPAQ
jgi:AsmA protein